MSRNLWTVAAVLPLLATACTASVDDETGSRGAHLFGQQGDDGPDGHGPRNGGWHDDPQDTGEGFFDPRRFFSFKRIATFPVFLNTDVDLETVSEIVAASEDGNTLIYTDGETDNIGFVDIADPSNPQPDGIVGVGGEPTSVAVAGRFALVGVNTSPDFVNPSGFLAVVNINTREVVREIDLGGQPDSVAVSPDNRYAAVAIENERDEDLGNGEPPQLPAGFVVIVDLVGPPRFWTTRDVDLTGVADVFPEDPEPEFIDINGANIAAVTLQENNHVVLIRLRNGRIIRDWNAGTVDLTQVDTVENELIELDSSLDAVPREPDAIAWIGLNRLATADEGDLFGGSRGFTIFNRRGRPRFEAGNTVEHLTARIGHYPEERSENKGNEPEAVEFGRYGFSDYLFVGSERSSVVAVYDVTNPNRPEFLQVLPAGVGPEGLLAIPSRNLFVVASEVDDRGDKIRAGISIYRLSPGAPTYPTVFSENRADGTPIPWAALSGLAAHPFLPNRAYTVYDSFFRESRIFALDLRGPVPRIDREIVLRDNGETLDLDPEGVARRPTGGFWVASEGAGSVDDPDRPVTSKNRLYRVSRRGRVLETVDLPDATNALQRRFGFEGVASRGFGRFEFVWVCFQREWVGDPDGLVRIGRYDAGLRRWTFLYYPLDALESPNGGWVGLSEIISLGRGEFAVLERDNQGGPDARVKRIYRFSVRDVRPRPEGRTFDVVEKHLVRDLLADLEEPNGQVIEKVEGLMRTANGNAWIVTDNDGVDDNSGETQLINLGRIFRD